MGRSNGPRKGVNIHTVQRMQRSAPFLMLQGTPVRRRSVHRPDRRGQFLSNRLPRDSVREYAREWIERYDRRRVWFSSVATAAARRALISTEKENFLTKFDRCAHRELKQGDAAPLTLTLWADKGSRRQQQNGCTQSPAAPDRSSPASFPTSTISKSCRKC